jgi:hypothetical protein
MGSAEATYRPIDGLAAESGPTTPDLTQPAGVAPAGSKSPSNWAMS